MFLAWLAMSMNLLAGTALSSPLSARATSAMPGEVCSSHGLVKPPASGDAAPDSQAATGHQCCGYCAAAGAPLAGAPALACGRAPTSLVQTPSPPQSPPAAVAAAAHRPRGPPLL